MATNNRDIKMTLSVETLGTEDLKRLQTEVEKLARQGGAAAPEFQKLADELNQLGQQNDTLAAFQRLAQATELLSQKQAEASQRSDELRTDYLAAREATDQAAEAQRRAQAAYLSNQKEIAGVNAELKVLRSTTDAAGKKTDEYKTQLAGLIAQQTALKQSSIDLGAARTEANSALTTAEAAEKKLQNQLKASEQSVSTLTRRLEEQKAALDQSRQAVEQFGLSTQDIASAQAQLQATFTRVAQSTQQLTAQLEQNTQAEKANTEAAKQNESQYQQNIAAINTFIKYRKQQAAEAEAAAERQAAAEKAAADAAIAARRAEQQESDRLYRLQEEGRQRLLQASRNALLAEQAAQREAAALSVRIEQEKRQAIEAAAKAQADSISEAWRTIGTRGAAELQAEIQKVRQAMQTLSTQAGLTGEELRTAMDRGQAEINELERELRQLNNTLTLSDRAALAFKNSMGQIAIGNIVADGIAYLVEKVKEMGREFIAVSLQADTMRRALNAIYKDANVTAQQIDFLRATATVAGVSVSNITNDFVKFSAATRASGISLETTNEVFRATTMAAASLGLGADKTSLALNALGQIASKGVVSMEELRQQLGDAIPGALSLTAQGLGVTDAQLIKLVESGQLASRDFFPAFAKGLQTLQGETDGLRNTWERFKNVLTITAQGGETNGTLVLLTGAVKVLGGFVGSLALGLSVLAEGLFSAGRAAIVFFEALRGNGREAMEWFNEETQKAVDRLGAQADAFNFMLNPTEELRQKMEANANAQARLRGEVEKVAPALQTSTEAIKANAEAAKSSEAGALAAAAAQQVSGNSALDASSKWVNLNLKMVELAQQQEQNVAISEKARAGAELEAQAVERIAALRGDEATKLNAAATAAQLNADALTRVAVARQNEAAVLAVQLNEMVKLAIAQDGSTLKRQTEIVAIEKKLLLLQEEASKATSAAEAARIETAQREIAIQTYKDNAAAMQQLAEAYKVTTDAVIVAEAQERLGLATKADVQAAVEANAKAYALYKDSVGDLVAAKQAEIAITNSANQTAIGAIRLRIEELRATSEVARARGFVREAIEAENEIKKLEIEILRLTAQGKRAEAQASMAAAEATRSHLIATGQWNKASEAAYQASIAKAKALENEAKIADITAKKLEELAKITDKAGNSARNAAGDYDKLAGSINRVAEASSSVSAAPSPSGGSGGSGGSSGPVSFTPSGNAIYLQKREAGTLGVEDINLVKGVYEAAFFNSRSLASAFGGSRAAGQMSQFADQAKRDYERLLELKNAGVTEGGAFDSRSISRNAGGGSGSSLGGVVGSSTPVTINLNGGSRRINVASPSDASTLESLLRELESSSGRSV